MRVREKEGLVSCIDKPSGGEGKRGVWHKRHDIVALFHVRLRLIYVLDDGADGANGAYRPCLLYTSDAADD